MSRTESESDGPNSGLSEGRNDLFGPIKLTNLLFQSVEATSKFIHFSLTRNAKILKDVVSVAFQIPAHLLLKLWGFPPQGLEHVIDQL